MGGRSSHEGFHECFEGAAIASTLERHPGITRQKDWWKSLLRDNPECRVESKSSKTQVSFAGLDRNPSENTGICPPAVSEPSAPVANFA